MLRAVAVALEEPAEATPRRRGRRWALLAAAVVVLVVLGYAVWWLVWSSPIEGASGFGISRHDSEPGEVYSITVAETLCLDGAERAVVEDVTVDPAGLTVTDFAARLRPEAPDTGFLGANGPLRGQGSGWGDAIEAQCHRGEYSEVAIELTRGVLGPAHTEVVNIHWSAGVRSGVLTLPVQVTLCATGQVDEYCEAPPPEWAPIPG
jgi:hypothetical protein